MEDDLLAGDDGLYCVSFTNVHRFSHGQLSEYLREYGRVVRLSGGGGMGNRRCLVRYANPEEAVRAMAALRSGEFTDRQSVEYVCNRAGDSAAPGPAPRANTGANWSRMPSKSPMHRARSIGARAGVRGGSVSAHKRSPSRTSTRSHSVARDVPSRYEVFVGNWPLHLSELDVRELFNKCQLDPVSVRIFKKELSSYVFVELQSVDEVREAVESLNNGRVAGRAITVCQSRHSVSMSEAEVKTRSSRGAVVNGVGRRGAAAAGGRDARRNTTPRSGAASIPSPPHLVMSGPRDQLSPINHHMDSYGLPPAPPLIVPLPDSLDDACFKDEFDDHSRGMSSSRDNFNNGGRVVRRAAGQRRGDMHFRPSPPLPSLNKTRASTRRTFSQRGDSECDIPAFKRRNMAAGNLDRAERDSHLMPPPSRGAGPWRSQRSHSGGGALSCVRPLNSQPVSTNMENNSNNDDNARQIHKAISSRIKDRLHSPVEVVVANFPTGSTEIDLLDLFKPYNPLHVRIMVNNSTKDPDGFTYAYMLLSSRISRDQAVMDMDGFILQGRPLVVETKKL